jgi:hypothetical protein
VTTVPVERVLDPSIPLCFDTNVVFVNGATRRFLDRIRERFPTRHMLLPALVIAERTRQLREKYRESYDPLQVDNFLNDDKLKLKVVSFNRILATTHWLDVVSIYDKKAWQERERSRFADHGIYASARARSAILVTGDGELRARLLADNYTPGTITADELGDVL